MSRSVIKAMNAKLNPSPKIKKGLRTSPRFSLRGLVFDNVQSQ